MKAQQWHEIVKYSPCNYDQTGRYLVDEWTSMSDIGKSYNGKVFTLEDYLKAEQQYVDVIHSILFVTGCTYLTISYLEADAAYLTKRIQSSPFHHIDSELLRSLSLLQEGRKIHRKSLDGIIRLSLREYAYVVLCSYAHNLQIEFGYDYYLKVSCSIDDRILGNLVQNVGLFLDPR